MPPCVCRWMWMCALCILINVKHRGIALFCLHVAGIFHLMSLHTFVPMKHTTITTTCSAPNTHRSRPIRFRSANIQFSLALWPVPIASLRNFYSHQNAMNPCKTQHWNVLAVPCTERNSHIAHRYATLSLAHIIWYGPMAVGDQPALSTTSTVPYSCVCVPVGLCMMIWYGDQCITPPPRTERISRIHITVCLWQSQMHHSQISQNRETVRVTLIHTMCGG